MKNKKRQKRLFPDDTPRVSERRKRRLEKDFPFIKWVWKSAEIIQVDKYTNLHTYTVFGRYGKLGIKYKSHPVTGGDSYIRVYDKFLNRLWFGSGSRKMKETIENILTNL